MIVALSLSPFRPPTDFQIFRKNILYFMKWGKICCLKAVVFTFLTKVT